MQPIWPCRKKSLGGPTADRLKTALTRWKADPDLAGLHARSELANLPENERKDCLALWAEVDDLLNRARQQP